MMQVQNEPGLLGKLFVLVITAILLVLGFMFSVVLLTVVAVLGLVAFAYFWWKTRALRKAMRERQPAGTGGDADVIEGDVIEGEAVVVEEYRVKEER
jgi:Flp pilus assembly protein TadB